MYVTYNFIKENFFFTVTVDEVNTNEQEEDDDGTFVFQNFYLYTKEQQPFFLITFVFFNYFMP